MAVTMQGLPLLLLSMAALLDVAYAMGQCPHTTSLPESAEFYCQSDAGWAVRKEVARRQHARNVNRKDANEGRFWFQANWEPAWHCELLERIGLEGDGGKWICDPLVLFRHPKCLVYSFGSNNDFSFEQAVLERWPHCEIHTFDHTSNPPPTPIVGLTFHSQGLGGAEDSVDPPLKTLGSHINSLGHEGRHIHALKIDVEGAELAAFEQLFKTGVPVLRNVRQILIELHWSGAHDSIRIHNFFMELHKIGFIIFSKEPNTLANGECIEFSLIYLGPSLLGEVPQGGLSGRRALAPKADV